MKRNRAEFSPSGGNGAVEFLSAEYVPTGFSPVTKERRVLARRRAGGFLTANLGGTAEVSRLLSQRNLSQVLYDGMRVFF